MATVVSRYPQNVISYRFSWGEHTIATLCNTHAFESAHPESYIITPKLLTCRFEVNFLHINPMICEICLIYNHFQQNFPYFSSYVNFYCIEICLPTAYLTSSLCVLKCGFPKLGLFFSNGFHCHKCPSQLLQIFGKLPMGVTECGTGILKIW